MPFCGHVRIAIGTDWIMPGKSYTRRQAKWVFEMCAKQPFTEVGALINMSHKTVERLYYHEVEARVDLPGRYAKVRKIGIDEIAHREGKQDGLCLCPDRPGKRNPAGRFAGSEERHPTWALSSTWTGFLQTD